MEEAIPTRSLGMVDLTEGSEKPRDNGGRNHWECLRLVAVEVFGALKTPRFQ